MLEIQGKFNKAKVFTDNIEESAYGQVLELCNQEFTKGSKIAIMPDVHAGKGCTIGTTMTITDKIVPNLVGVDIGCGVTGLIVKIAPDDIDFEKLQNVIKKYVPSGSNRRDQPAMLAEIFMNHNYDKLKVAVNLDMAETSLGTLGGGNHFIELVEYDKDHVMLVVHSGSRGLGVKVAQYHQNRAIMHHFNRDQTALINDLRTQGKHSQIQQAIQEFKADSPKFPKDLAYLEGEGLEKYLQDMAIAQDYAALNRDIMLREIVYRMDWMSSQASIDTVHNYIDLENKILRKGAVSAQAGEDILIPLNMRDGIILAKGKGNPDWNYSAPHGAGRIYSRSKAKRELSLEDFENTMEGVWSQSVGASTLDEAPMAYKDMKEIIDHTEDTIEIQKIMKPLFNFKATE